MFSPPLSKGKCKYEQEVSHWKFYGALAQRVLNPLARLRDNQRLGCGIWQPSRMASCFIQRDGEGEPSKFAEGSPAADSFLCAAKERNQRNAAPPRQPAAFFGWMNPSGGCATRPDGAHTPRPTAELKQCSPKTPDRFIQPKWRRRGEKQKPQTKNKTVRQSPLCAISVLRAHLLICLNIEHPTSVIVSRKYPFVLG